MRKSVVSPRLRVIGQYGMGFAFVSRQNVHAVVYEPHGWRPDDVLQSKPERFMIRPSTLCIDAQVHVDTTARGVV